MATKNTKYAWIAMFLMAVNIILISDMGFKITAPMGYEEAYSLSKVVEMTGVVNLLRYINMGVGGLLCFVLITGAGDKIWQVPTATVGVIGLLAMLFLYGAKDKIFSVTGLGDVYNHLGIDITPNGSVWVFLAVSIAILFCGVRPYILKAKEK